MTSEARSDQLFFSKQNKINFFKKLIELPPGSLRTLLFGALGMPYCEEALSSSQGENTWRGPESTETELKQQN